MRDNRIRESGEEDKRKKFKLKVDRAINLEHCNRTIKKNQAQLYNRNTTHTANELLF